MPAIHLTSSTYRGFAALTGSFWHSRTASANSVTLLAFGRAYEVMLRVRIAAPDASMHFKVDDVRIREIKELAPPVQLLREFPCSERTEELTYHTRQAIH